MENITMCTFKIKTLTAAFGLGLASASMNAMALGIFSDVDQYFVHGHIAQQSASFRPDEAPNFSESAIGINAGFGMFLDDRRERASLNYTRTSDDLSLTHIYIRASRVFYNVTDVLAPYAGLDIGFLSSGNSNSALTMGVNGGFIFPINDNVAIDTAVSFAFVNDDILSSLRTILVGVQYSF